MAAFVGAAVVFGLGIWATLGPDKAAQYFAGYLLEQSLSVDNLFVFVLVFDYFKTDQAGQDKARAACFIHALMLQMFACVQHARGLTRCWHTAWRLQRCCGWW